MTRSEVFALAKATLNEVPTKAGLNNSTMGGSVDNIHSPSKDEQIIPPTPKDFNSSVRGLMSRDLRLLNPQLDDVSTIPLFVRSHFC
jgi:hypothetical protein